MSHHQHRFAIRVLLSTRWTNPISQNLRATLQPNNPRIFPQQQQPTIALSQRSLSSSSSSEKAPTVGIFIDADNVRPNVFDRETIQQTLVQPLRTFAEQTGRELRAFRAYGNKHTTTHEPPEEKSRDFDQEWIPIHTGGGSSVTGYDETGSLRCGICGQKMKLNKKERARGWDEMDKLDKHMRTLHDREQRKRNSQHSGSKKKRRSEKEMAKSAKYREAQIGLRRNGVKVGSKTNQRRNKFFQVLRLEKVHCYEVYDVDWTLDSQARKWLAENPPESVLVVVSKDSDFAPLLKAAKNKGIYAISAATDSSSQTKKLESSCDVVLRQSDRKEDDAKRVRLPSDMVVHPFTARGTSLVMDMIDSSHDIQ